MPSRAIADSAARGRRPLDPAQTEIREGMLLMGASLLFMLGANALARELATRLPVGEIVFFRFLVALPIVLACSLRPGVGADGTWRRSIEPTQRHWLHVARAVFVVAATVSFYASSRHLPFADLVAIASSTPIFVALLSWPLLGERVGARAGALIAIGFVGVAMIAFPGRFEPWSFGALAMALCNTGAVLCTRSLGKTESAAAIGSRFACYGLILSVPGLALGFLMPLGVEFALLAALGLCAGLAIHLHAHAFRRAPASVLAPVDYVGVMLSIMIGFAVWSEIPSPFMIAGGMLIVASGVLRFRWPG